jgi:hypothetical protein
MTCGALLCVDRERGEREWAVRGVGRERFRAASRACCNGASNGLTPSGGSIRWVLVLLGLAIFIGGYLMGTRYYGHPETKRLGNLAFWARFPGAALALHAALNRPGRRE